MRPATAFGIVFALIAFVSGAVAAPAAEGFAPIEIRLVAEQPGHGQALAVEGSDKTLEVEPETLLGPADFVSVGEVAWIEGKPGFNVALTPAGTETFERVSAANVGRIVAVIVDGRILMAPKILDPVRADGFLLTTENEAEARDLAAKVRQVVGPK